MLSLTFTNGRSWPARSGWIFNKGNVLNRMKAQNDEKHVCPLQLDVIERCLRLYSKPGDVVMDPFNGIGSTGYQAVKMFRRYLWFELKPEYAAQANKNLKKPRHRRRSFRDCCRMIRCLANARLRLERLFRL